MARIQHIPNYGVRRRGMVALAVAVLAVVAIILMVGRTGGHKSEPTPAPTPRAAVTTEPLDADTHFVSHLRVRGVWIDGYSDSDMVELGYRICDRYRADLKMSYLDTIRPFETRADHATIVVVADAATILCSDVDF